MAPFLKQFYGFLLICALIDSVHPRDEVVNGDIVTDPEELPFVCRIVIRGFSKSQFCGGSLISGDFLATAKHCVDEFYDLCVRIQDCYVTCRDLNREEHEIGQFRVSIIDVFLKPGRSDLALVKLKDPVQKHPDYALGTPIAPVILASEEPMPGELVLTAGWGRTGYKEGPSKQLRRLELEVTSVDDLWVFTGVTNSRGQLVDTCEGDSGGPLLVQREGQWHLVGTLKVNMSCHLTVFFQLTMSRAEALTARTTRLREMESGTMWSAKVSGFVSRCSQKDRQVESALFCMNSLLFRIKSALFCMRSLLFRGD